MPHQQGIRQIAQNRKAFHDYFVEEKLECASRFSERKSRASASEGST